MDLSRRSFMAAGAASLAVAYSDGLASQAFTGETGKAAKAALPPEDGSKLWLRFPPLGTVSQQYKRSIRQIVVRLVPRGESATANIIGDELNSAIAGLFGAPLPAAQQNIVDGTILVGTPQTSSEIKALSWAADLEKSGPDGFVIRSTSIDGHPVIVIASVGEIGALYGTFHFLRLLQTGQSIDQLNIIERPKVKLRVLNHWDNLDGSIERGYAGRSLWQWNQLPDTLSPRYTEYARANASIGINGAVLNNVNANVRMLTPEYLAKAAALANVWRPYGIRVYLSLNYAAPRTLGNLPTADPLDPAVIAWWKSKADEIYKLIPDFGGFLVKANSEGQPGPKDYGRTHAEGANVLADALAPHGGSVMWRAFIYDENVDPDRAKRAYIEFMALEGKFRPNVLIQVKNGPVDFQPREPFHPLFGGLKQTPVLCELQPTQEYLGQAKHLVYLGTMWKEFLDADTYAKGQGSTVGKVLDGSVYNPSVTGMVAVLNTGTDANWCGHHFCQANWYAFGRLAWNHELTADGIAEEWTRMTFTNDAKSVATIKDMMMSSRETFVNYTMPLGLHHLIGGDHYAPQPWNASAQRRDWTAVYYHQADEKGIGFDRTKTGNKAVEQYFPPVCDMWDELARCPEIFLLWFHRCAWDYKMKSGQTLWKELCDKYYLGAQQAAALQATWATLADKIDPARHKHVADRLAIQVADSAKWRDAILQYFQRFSKMPIAGAAST
jgi:alpha-glucuronidase